VALAVRDVSVRFGGVVAVDAMHLDAAPGEIVGLIGPNGAGKTTFINAVTGLCRPQAGSATWQGREMLGLSPAALLRRGVARTFQSVASLHDLTVLDLVRLGAAGARRAADAALVETLLRPLRLAEVAEAPLQTLSYGQRKAVDLARALAARPSLLLLDEPVAGLTAHEARAMAAVIREVRDLFRCTVIMVEHKLEIVMSTCERIVVMAAGRHIFAGSPAAAQADREVRRVYLGEP
jgi:branched-chain amino acid transport system ATP-binding protein